MSQGRGGGQGSPKGAGNGGRRMGASDNGEDVNSWRTVSRLSRSDKERGMHDQTSVGGVKDQSGLNPNRIRGWGVRQLGFRQKHLV